MSLNSPMLDTHSPQLAHVSQAIGNGQSSQLPPPMAVLGVPVLHVLAASDTFPKSQQAGGRCQITMGGRFVNVARSFRLAYGQSPVLRPIIANDRSGDLATRLLQREHQIIRPIHGLDMTRAAVVFTSTAQRRSRRLINTQPEVDHQDVISALSADHFLWGLAGMSARDNPFILDLLDRLPNTSPRFPVWMHVSPSQCSDPQGTLALMQRCRNQLDARDAARLTGRRRVIDAICAMREAGVNSVNVITGTHGIVGFHDGRWHYVPGHDLQASHSLPRSFGADVAMGTMMAAHQANMEFGEALRLANAAVAMLQAGVPRTGGWSELRQFRSVAPYRKGNLAVSRATSAAIRWGHAGIATLFVMGLVWVASHLLP